MTTIEIQELINQNIDTINNSDNKSKSIIQLLENNKPKLNLYNAIYGTNNDFTNALNAISDITQEVIQIIKNYNVNKERTLYVGSDKDKMDQINLLLTYIYEILESKPTI